MPIRSFPIGSFPTRRARGHEPRGAVALTRVARAACIALALAAAAPAAAQQQGAGANAAAGNDRAAARAENEPLRGISKEDALLGGPGAYRDPYRSQYDAGETGESDLMKAERVPNGATDQGAKGYDPLPPGGRRQLGRAAGAAADAGGAGAGGGAGGGNAAVARGNGAPGAAPPDTAQQAAKSLYSDPFGGGAKGAAQQVYHTPW
ncbi:hypothetical protein [Trinickia symbiotica]|uniref:Uncharacterized protein n=1 Tax=Trinickia symbiotica TaxID=863227 RepID=A0A2N7X0W7_9BURK|nr:hypothetical protein [Trinickia symbiotica]PMS35383.1 hypothetical protein C0Z20_17955 [Trinickia symbiotica]